jgi:hypothetical protein
MAFGRRSRLIGAISGGLYALTVSAFFVFCWAHPTGLGYEWIYPMIVTFPWSGFGRFPLGMFLGVPLNAALVYFVAAGLVTAISRDP